MYYFQPCEAKMKRYSLLILFFLTPSLCFGGVWFVAPNGSDNNPGTREKPFASIPKAVNAPDGQGTKTIFLEQGTYFLTEPIRVKSAMMLVGKTTETEQPATTISGGRKITGFKEIEKGLAVADIPDVKAGKWDFRDLYVNDERAIRARTPNTGYFRVEKAGEDRRTNFTYNEGDLKKWKDIENVELVFLHDWSVTRCPVKSIDEQARRLTVPIRIGCNVPAFRIDGWEPHPRYFVENSIEFLDAPGEWFLDTKEGKLFYHLKEGESTDTLEVIAPVTTQLLVFEGTGEQKIGKSSLENIRFSHAAYFPKQEKTAWEVQGASFMPFGSSRDVESENFASPAAVHCEYVSDMTIAHCRFEHLGENGLWFSKGCSRCTVTNSQFRDIGANGIMIGAHDHANAVEECTVSNSLVEKTGRTLFGAVGIWIGIAQKTDIFSNVVRQTHYTGISCGWQWNPDPTPARENKIRNNHIYDCLQTLSDGGGIYILGLQPDSVIEGNIIHGIPRASGRAESNGMFLDEGTTGFTIRDNVIYNTEQSLLRFHRAGKNVVQGNILSNKEGVPMFRYNSTPEENIGKIDNRNLKPDSPEFIEAVKRIEAIRAGVSHQH